MKRGPTTAKEHFEIYLRLAIQREMRRRKTGRYVVLRHVVDVANSMRDPKDPYSWWLLRKN